MTDKSTLDLARQWAADIDADRETLSQDTIDAAADLISSLPDAWVGADTLRKYIADWREGLATAPRGNYESEMLDDLEDMLPAPPKPAGPRTMAEIEWDDEHQGLEAVYESGLKFKSVVRMLYPMEHNGDDGIVCVEKSGEIFCPYPRYLTPLPGTKIDLTPASPLEDKPAPESASPHPEDVPVGEAWQVEVYGHTAIGYRNAPGARLCWAVVYPHDAGRHWMHDKDVTLIARLVPETTEQDDEQVLDPAYTYRDRDGDEWKLATKVGRWVCNDSDQGFDAPPAEYGPYTRIEDTK